MHSTPQLWDTLEDTLVGGSSHKFHSQTMRQDQYPWISCTIPPCSELQPNWTSALEAKLHDVASAAQTGRQVVKLMQAQAASNKRNCIFFPAMSQAGTISVSDSALSSETHRDGKDKSVSVSVSPKTSAHLQYPLTQLHKPQVLRPWQYQCCAPILLSSASPVLAPWPGILDGKN